MEGDALALATRLRTLLVIAILGLAFAGLAQSSSPPPIEIGISSQQAGPSRARVDVGIAGRYGKDGRQKRRGSRSTTSVVRLPVKGGAVEDVPSAADLPLESDSPLAQNPEPWGPGSFWYPGPQGTVCVYAPGTLGPCYRLVGPGRPGLDPIAIAASVADRLLLLPGRIQTSPRALGLTGAVAWFWLEPVPEIEELTVSIFGETVTVAAEPVRVEWRFGDGTGVAGGPGIPYRTGPPAAGANLHTYETRCLQGDRGRNPYVLGSCGAEGYGVEAVVSWRISFVATGPIDASGTLPTRTTAASASYPVSESRAFLIPGTSR